jgi:uncharacterized protein (TIGR00369 family)
VRRSERSRLDRPPVRRYRGRVGAPPHNSAGTFRGCFGCGPENPVGLKLAFRRERDSVVSEITLDENYAGYRQFIHGGVVATLLDEGMGWALVELLGRYGVTRSLQVTYRRPVRLGQSLTITSKVLAQEGANVTVESVLEDGRGRLLARGEGAWVLVRDERAAATGS